MTQRIHREREDLPIVYMRPKDAVQMFGISRARLYVMMNRHPDHPEYLKTSKLGGARLIKRTDLEELLERLAE